uniref:Cystatin domain-containing protein n=1 Tax=Trichuris muris TaxID=70415 RepID=A0A5S6Q474_TRIMR
MAPKLFILAVVSMLLCCCLARWLCSRANITDSNEDQQKEWGKAVANAVNEDPSFDRGNYWKLYAVEKLASKRRRCGLKSTFDVIVAETDCLKPRIITPKTDSLCPFSKNAKCVQANITVKQKKD